MPFWIKTLINGDVFILIQSNVVMNRNSFIIPGYEDCKNTSEGHLGVALLHQFAFPGLAEAGQELFEDLHRLSQRSLLVVLAHRLVRLILGKLVERELNFN